MCLLATIFPFRHLWGFKKNLFGFSTRRDPIKETSSILITKPFHVSRSMFWFEIRSNLELLDIFVKEIS